ncbi:hypothetical protein FD30_GL001691 [Levilactobacillus namurensis DSM 19117]|uniref:PTS EIIB type-3 domain-containing protein n=1 Tax=Levilactobacillus namurensis DSM 19117 TaxID=1423773 RepID=A0A0R1JXU9_9LACO|nr:cellobiose-specific PTS system IIC component [Levilactobacillus namurensis]PTM21314.1 cellobiose PTS IIC subunit [Lactobacillus sp. PFC-70]KRK76061.1 hypothetical protein FD30_GL001691 [Levilactobacillus namurensis DSM 19117]MCW3779487.1 cellobiose PTS IIC subunit [Levilactobacillus namurensis]MDT7017913.1 cellobiose PTS IIC subunit [Levilactobacillus namurensis]WNN65086.1 cellobiose PTS IIC subunit [Levilactobacillus namurensis]
MKNVLLVSGRGITSRLFLGEAKRVAETRHANLKFTAVGLADLTPELLSQQALVLYTPQAAYQAATDLDQQGAVQTAVIPNDIYGWLNSEALVKFAMHQLAATPVVA